LAGVSGMLEVVPSLSLIGRPHSNPPEAVCSCNSTPAWRARSDTNASGSLWRALQYAPLLALASPPPPRLRIASSRATAAWQLWSGQST